MSTTHDARARNGVFASQNLNEKNIAGLHYGLLACRDHRRELQSRKQYEKGYMRATAKSLRQWALELSGKALDCEEGKTLFGLF